MEAFSGGGAFNLFLRDDANQANDQLLATTFCVEFDEHIQLGRNHWMYVGSATDRAIQGGAGPSPDMLDERTDFLYRAYARGELDSFDLGGGMKFSYNDKQSANALQRALWYIEQERAGFEGDALAEALYNYADANATTLSGGVFVLNLFRKNAPFDYLRDTYNYLDKSTWDDSSRLANYHRQDQLFYDASFDGSGGAVPEPATLLAWLTLGGCALAVRRRSAR